MTFDPVLISVPVADRARAHDVVQRARRAGALVAAEPAPQPWGYAATFGDPDGHLWSVTSATLPG